MWFTDLLRRSAPKSATNVGEPLETSGSTNPKKVDASAPDDELSGIEIKEYAKKYQVTIEAVWSKIREGKLVARTENGFVYVYGAAVPPALENRPPSQPAPTMPELPPLPTFSETDLNPSALPAIIPTHTNSPEIALLLDHLALAKQQNRELMRISQDSMSHMRSMVEKVIAAKEDLITIKDSHLETQAKEIAELKQKLDAEVESKRKLKQDLEDYEMLAKTLTNQDS